MLDVNPISPLTITFSNLAWIPYGGIVKDDKLQIKKVIYNEPATIVLWKDGTKTVVKCQNGDVYDPDKGLLLCIVKRVCGNKGRFNNDLNKWFMEKPE